MSLVNCRFCGKDITGKQISCWPYDGYMCYDCKHTKYKEWIKKDAEKNAEISKERESLKPRDTIAWFLEKELGFKTELVDGKLYFKNTDSLGNELKYWFIKDNDDKWFMMFKGEGLEMKYDCEHLLAFHYEYEEKDNKVGFWYNLKELENFKTGKSDYGPDIIVAHGEDVYL